MLNNEFTETTDHYPSQDDYMNPAQLAYFEGKLRRLRQELLSMSHSAKNELKETGLGAPDLNDVATAQSEITIELEGLKRNRGHIRMIDRALARISDGSYGYCEMTGEQIGLKRLEIQPIATLSVEAQEMVERCERGMRFAKIHINQAPGVF